MGPSLDETFGDSYGLFIKKNLAQKNANSVFQLIAKDQNPHTQSLYIDIATQFLHSKEADTIVSDNPSQALAYTIRGAAKVKWAWDARSRQLAQHLSKQQIEMFLSFLNSAVEDLHKAIKMDPTTVLPYVYLIPTLMGLEAEIDDIFKVFQQGKKKHLGNFQLHKNMLIASTAKWLGSHERMFDFARTNAKESIGECSLLPILIIMAHIEYHLYLRGIENKPHEAEVYAYRKDIIEEARQAYVESLGKKNCTFGKQDLIARNYAAYWFYVSNQKDLLKKEMKIIGTRYIIQPWGYLSPPHLTFRDAMRACLF